VQGRPSQLITSCRQINVIAEQRFGERLPAVALRRGEATGLPLPAVLDQP